MRITFDVDQFLTSWSRMEQRMDSAGYRAWRDALAEAKRSMVQHGYTRRSGMLDKSMRYHGRKLGTFRYAGDVVAKAPYAAYVDNGTRPHRIGTKDKKVLRWFSGGRPVFARSVFHPGTKAAGFSLQAIETFERVADVRISAALAKAQAGQ